MTVIASGIYESLMGLLITLGKILWQTIQTFGMNESNGILQIGLKIECIFPLAGVNFDALSTVIATFAISLLTLKFVKKIADVYALQTDGDPNGDIAVLVTNYCKAVVVSLVFTTIWGFILDILLDFNSQLWQAAGQADSGSIFSLVTAFFEGGFSDGAEFFWKMAYYWIGGVLLITLFMDGLELWLVRLGVPLAACGMLDSDSGIWKQYMRIFLKVILTIMIKLLMWRVSMVFMVVGSGEIIIRLILAIMSLIVAFRMPKLLSELLIPKNGGGAGGKIMQVAYLGFMISRSVI